MKIIFQFVFLFLISSSISAQKKSGTIIYKIANIDLVNNDNNIDVANMLETAKAQQYTLNFNSKYASFTISDAMPNESINDFYMGMAKGYVSGSDFYFDYIKKVIIEVVGDGTLLEQKLEELPWQIFSETKVIGQYQCYKATYDFEYRTRDNKTATRTVTAWFAPSLPYSFGPKQYYGLPGLILELTDRNITFLASKIKLLDNEIEIKIPIGNRISKEQFEKALLNIKY